MSPPLMDTVPTNLWPMHIPDARKVWPDLSDEELRESEGDPVKLADIVQMRYAISFKSASGQVDRFLRDRRSVFSRWPTA